MATQDHYEIETNWVTMFLVVGYDKAEIITELVHLSLCQKHPNSPKLWLIMLGHGRRMSSNVFFLEFTT